MDALVPVIAITALFIGLPWLILHYMTRWRQAASLTLEDEKLLDELHETALRLEERVRTVERILSAEDAERGEGQQPPARIPPARDGVAPAPRGVEGAARPELLVRRQGD